MTPVEPSAATERLEESVGSSVMALETLGEL